MRAWHDGTHSATLEFTVRTVRVGDANGSLQLGTERVAHVHQLFPLHLPTQGLFVCFPV